MPIMYGMVAGRDHGCDKQPLTAAQKAQKQSFRKMNRYECVNIGDLLGEVFRKEGPNEREIG